MINTFYKDYLEKPIAIFLSSNFVLSITKPIIKSAIKQKCEKLIKNSI